MHAPQEHLRLSSCKALSISSIFMFILFSSCTTVRPDYGEGAVITERLNQKIAELESINSDLSGKLISLLEENRRDAVDYQEIGNDLGKSADELQVISERDKWIAETYQKLGEEGNRTISEFRGLFDSDKHLIDAILDRIEFIIEINRRLESLLSDQNK